LDINISPARCATHLKQDLGDDAIETEIKNLRNKLTTANEAEQKHIKEEIAQKSKNLVRISSATPIAVAVIADSTVKELLRHGMDQAIKANKKIVTIDHLHEPGDRELEYLPLYNKCDSWVNYVKEEPKKKVVAAETTPTPAPKKKGTEEPAAEAAPTPKKKKGAVEESAAETTSKKKKGAVEEPAAETTSKKKKGAVEEPAAETTSTPASKKKKGAEEPAAEAAPKKKSAAVEPAPVADINVEEEGTKTTFYTYVENALKTVRKENESYTTIRVSNPVREYLSDLVTHIITRQAKLAKIIVQRGIGVRTMNADHIKVVVNILMAEDNRSAEQIEAVTNQIDTKLKLYHEHLQVERDKKSSEMDDDKKADLERKKMKETLTRKTHQAEKAEKQARAAAVKMKALKEEAKELKTRMDHQ
jgi:hypothetical protein